MHDILRFGVYDENDKLLGKNPNINKFQLKQLNSINKTAMTLCLHFLQGIQNNT